jgi:hypothetical protein
MAGLERRLAVSYVDPLFQGDTVNTFSVYLAARLPQTFFDLARDLDELGADFAE